MVGLDLLKESRKRARAWPLWRRRSETAKRASCLPSNSIRQLAHASSPDSALDELHMIPLQRVCIGPTYKVCKRSMVMERLGVMPVSKQKCNGHRLAQSVSASARQKRTPRGGVGNSERAKKLDVPG